MEQQELLKRINSFTPEYQEFVLSDFTEKAVKAVLDYGYPNLDTTILENGIFLYLTLFLHKFALTEFIITECYLPISEAKKITDIIIKMMPLEMTDQQKDATIALEAIDESVKEKDRFAIISRDENLLNQYLYLKTSDFPNKLGQRYLGDNSELIDEFKIVISDIALGFYKNEDTVPLLQQELEMDPKKAALLGAEVLDLLEIITDKDWQPPPKISSTNTNPELTGQTSTIIPQLRTMAADMEEWRSPVRSSFNAGASLDEPVYTSTQPTTSKNTPDAPSYSAPLYQAPKPNPDVPLEKPRWS